MSSPVPYECAETATLFVCESGFAASKSEHPRSDETMELNQQLALLRVFLHRVTLRRVRNSEDAEDLVQETLLTLAEKYSDSAFYKGAVPWCFGVLRRKLGNYYRKVRRSAPLEGNDATRPRAGTRTIADASPEHDLMCEELRLLALHIISRMPPLERQPMELLVAGHRVWEIARQLNTQGYQNVVNHIYRGRRKLARELVRHGYPSAR